MLLTYYHTKKAKCTAKNLDNKDLDKERRVLSIGECTAAANDANTHPACHQQWRHAQPVISVVITHHITVSTLLHSRELPS